MRSALLFLLLPTLTLAQSSNPRPEDLGTVTGHITCADTQRPARLAQVRLISVRNARPYPPNYPRPSTNSFTTGLTVHTDLTGAYTITGVEPGRYYLRVDLPGYATPIAQFTFNDFKSPTPQVQPQIQRDLQLVTVLPNSTTQADATIQRGGSISGTVTFDDGSPAIAIGINLLHRDAEGRLQSVPASDISTDLEGDIFTNGHGEFRIEPLSPGEYVVQAKIATFEPGRNMEVSNAKVETIPGESVTSFLSIYSGNVFRQKKAIPIKIDAGQEADGADINIPLSRLHDISGTILANDGHSISFARIDLSDPETRELIVTAWVHGEGKFRLHNVPEGTYTLRVADASDLGQLRIVHAGDDPATGWVERPTLRTYGYLEQPLTVTTDIQSLILTVPEKPTATASK